MQGTLPTVRPSILAIGAVAIDQLLLLDNFPLEESKAMVIEQSRSLGGCIATAAKTAAVLGAKVGYAAALGVSANAQFVVDELTFAGVDTSLVRRDQGGEPIHSTILVNRQNGSRTVLYDLAGALPASEDWPPEETLTSADLLLIDHFGMEGMLRAAKLASARKIPIVADFEHDGRPEFSQLLALVDHLILSRDFALRITGTASPQDACNTLWSSSRAVVAITCGAQGLWFRDASTSTPTAIVPPIVTARNTTGCGDVFHGAYAATFLQSRDIKTSLARASEVAAQHASQR